MLINVSEVRKLVLELAKKRWPKGPHGRRISRGFIERIDSQIRTIIQREIHQHPSVGKTLM